MLVRLGRVIYWLGCGFAALWSLFAAAGLFFLLTDSHARADALIIGLIGAMLSFGIGRGARYVLSAE